MSSIKDEEQEPSTKTSTIKQKIRATLGEDPNNPDTTLEEKVSTNAKIVLIALFATLIGIIALYTAALAMGIAVGENLNAVFIAGVTGIVTLGGTLISNLWGKTR